MAKRYAVSYDDFKVENFQDVESAKSFLFNNGGVLFELGDSPKDGIRAQHAQSPNNDYEFQTKMSQGE